MNNEENWWELDDDELYLDTKEDDLKENEPVDFHLPKLRAPFRISKATKVTMTKIGRDLGMSMQEIANGLLNPEIIKETYK